MLDRPGFYAISSDGFKKTYSVVEVEPDRTCHQITPALRRDGVLREDRWHGDVQATGPFETAFDAEAAMRLKWYGAGSARQ
jgi:hypothetical protein